MSRPGGLAEPATTWATLRRGLALSPQLRRGLATTVALALVATAGRVAVPVVVQQTIDRGLAGAGPDLPLVRRLVLLGAAVVVVSAAATYATNVRLYRTSETALADLRARAFRHVHDLSVLHRQEHRRGALVSRVTSDIDQISTFVQWGGIMVVVSAGQLLMATVLMAVYSVPLTLLVWACFLPLLLAVRRFQRRLAAAYSAVRERVGELLGVVAESVVGAPVIRAYGIEERTAGRLDRAIARHRRAQERGQLVTVLTFTTAEVVAGLAMAAVVVAGVALGVAGRVSAGELTAFLFLLTLFVQPVQLSTEVLNQAQTAIAGWRRVIGVLDTPADVADPGPAGRPLPPGPLRVSFADVRFVYPGGPPVLHGLTFDLAAGSRVAVVGETGSGKTTLVRLLTRLADPTTGQVLLSGVPLAQVRFADLRRRVVMVPQDGFLFDTTVAANVRYGRPEAGDDDLALAVTELGLSGWVDGLPDGMDTPVGQRGEELSVGERQLVALARAYLADPDLLVLDEATSAVDPATEVRLQRALEALTRGRTTLTVAHRMSTAAAADEVLVVHAGRIVQRGRHAELLRAGGRYAQLYAAWTAARVARPA